MPILLVVVRIKFNKIRQVKHLEECPGQRTLFNKSLLLAYN